MTDFDVFNGDADGICALHQLRLAEPRDCELVTGVKRDIALLRRVAAGPCDRVTVLDISLDKNRDALVRLLDDGAQVQYFDHHYAGEIPVSDALDARIDTSADVCTSLLVNDYLGGAHLAWAVAAAFGDNMFDAARRAAAPLELGEARLGQLEALGTLINYNGYGVTLQDLYFDPADLYRALRPFADPFDFIASSDAYRVLADGYAADMQQAAQSPLQAVSDTAAVVMLPDEVWARRVSGVYGNRLVRDCPERAHALVTQLAGGDYRISVRAPLVNKTGADELCMQFPTGGGRKASAGINALPHDMLDAFIEAFRRQY